VQEDNLYHMVQLACSEHLQPFEARLTHVHGHGDLPRLFIAGTALFAASFFSLSTLPRVLVCRRSTYAAHLAFDQPGGFSFGACGFLAFGAPSSAIFFGDMVVEGKRWSCNCGEWR
jgi:hypothetical protein